MQCTQVLYDSGEDSAEVHREPRVEGLLEVNGKSFNVMTGENIIGRDPELSSIVLQFQAISAEHAKIDAGPDGHTLSDTGSRNKTKLKEKVLKPHVQYFLEDGDTIFFADIKAVYHISPEEDEKPNGERDVIPETPARLPRSVIDKSVIIPETPDAKDTSGLDESFLPSSQSVTEDTFKNDATSLETSFVASSQPPQRPSTAGAQLDNNMETPVAERDSSRLRSSIESQASLNLVLSESLTDNGTPLRSLEERSKANATNASGNGRSIYEAETQVMAFSSTGIVIETPDKLDSQSSTPDLDESLLYGANTQIVFSPDSFKKPSNRRARKLSLAKGREDCANGSPDVGSANDSIYEADTQLIFPSDINSPVVERGSQNGTLGREENLYEAYTQVLPSPKSNRSARKKVQFSFENGSDDGTPNRRNEDIYAAETQGIPLSDVREEVYDAETQVLSGLVQKDLACGSKEIYEAETQLLPDRETGSSELEDQSIYDAETQALTIPVNPSNEGSKSDSACESGAKPCKDNGKVCDKYEDSLNGKVSTLFSKKPSNESEIKNDDIYAVATQVIPRRFTRGRRGSDNDNSRKDDERKNRASAGKAVSTITAVPASDSDDTDAEDLPTRPIGKKDSADKSGNSKTSCQAADSDDTDCEDTFPCPARKNDESEVLPTSEEKANDGDETNDNIFNCPTQKITPTTPTKTKDKKLSEKRDGGGKGDEDVFSCPTQKISPKALPKSLDKTCETNDDDMLTCTAKKITPITDLTRAEDEKSSKANDSDEADDEDMFSCPTQKITPKASTKTEGTKSSKAKDSDKKDDEGIFSCPTQMITPKAPTRTGGRKSSKANDSDETDDEDMFSCPTQKIAPKAPTKSHDRKTSESNYDDMLTCTTKKKTPKAATRAEDEKSLKANDSGEMDDEDIFSCPTQKITPKVPTRAEDEKSFKANDSEETDDEDIFSCPTQKITLKAPTKTEGTKSLKANDSDATDDEDMFSCPTQKITPKVPTRAEDEKSFRANDSEETDEEDMFTSPTQKITPKAPTETEDKKMSEADDGLKEDIFNCPTQKIPDGEKTMNCPTELTGAVTESTLMDGDNSNDSETLLRGYKDDDEVGTSPSPDLGSVGEAQSPGEAVDHSRDSTPDDLAALLTNDVDTQQDTSSAKQIDESSKEQRTDKNEERSEEPGNERYEDRCGKLCKERIEERREDSNEELATEQIEGPSKERVGEQREEPSKGQREDRTEERGERPTEELDKEEREEHTEELGRERLTYTKERSKTRRKERTEGRHGKRNEDPEDVVESAELLFPVNHKLDVSLEGTSGITRSKQVRPDQSGAIQPEEENIKEEGMTAASIEEDQPKQKRGRQKKSISRYSVAAHSTPEKSRQNDVTHDVKESERADTPLQGEEVSESSQQRRLGRPTRTTSTPSKVEVEGSQHEPSHGQNMKVTEKPVVELNNERVLGGGSGTPKSKRGKEGKTSSYTFTVESAHIEKLSSVEMPVDSDNEEKMVVPRTAELPRPKRGKLAKTSSQTLQRGKLAKPSSQTLLSESLIIEKLRQSSVGKLVEKHNEEDNHLPSNTESPRPKRGKLSKTSSQTSAPESIPTEEMSSEKKHVESESENDRVIPSAATSPRPKRGKLAKASSQTSTEESKPTEKLSSAGKLVESESEDDRVIPSAALSPRPKRGKISKTSSQMSAPESLPTEEMSSAEKPVESESEDDRVIPSAATSPRPKRGKLAKASSQTSTEESKPTEKSSSAGKLIESECEDDRVIPSAALSPKPKRGKLLKRSSQTSAPESIPTEEMCSAGKPVESESEDDRVIPSAVTSPRPKRGKLSKTSSQMSVAELRQSSTEKPEEKRGNEENSLLPGSSESQRPKRGKLARTSSQTSTEAPVPTEKSSLAGKPVESESEDDRVTRSAVTSPRPKRGKLSKTSSQTSVAVLRQSSTEKSEEKHDNEEDSLLPGSSESQRPKRGILAKTSSLSLASESKVAEKLRPSSVERPLEKQGNEGDKVLPCATESPRPKRGRQTKTSSQPLVAESKRSEKLRHSIEMYVEKRDVKERVIPGGSEAPRLVRRRMSKTSSQSLIAETKPSKKLSKNSAEKPTEERVNEENGVSHGSSEAPQTKKGKFSNKNVSLMLEAEKSNEREETASTSTKGGSKRPSPQSDDEKRCKRAKMQEVPSIDGNVLKLKGKRQLYSPRGPDKIVLDSEEENDDASTPYDEPSSEDISTRRSGRVKKPTWKVRGGDTGLTKKLVLSYSQDTDDAAAVSSEEESSVKPRGRGRPKKSSLTPKDSPAEPRRKKVDEQPRSSVGRFSKRKGSAEEEPLPSKTKKMDVPRRLSKARGSKLNPQDSDCESVRSEAGSVRPGRRPRLDSSDSVQSTPLTRSSSIMSETQSPSRRSVQRQPKQIHRVLFTGFADGKLEKLVPQLGAKIVDSVDEATVAVTDKLRRTVKLLSMMARGQPIVSPDWITQSQKIGHFRDPWECILSDTESEKKFDFNMERSLRAAASKKLLDGYTIFVTKSVSPPPEAMEEIIKSSGGVMVKKLLPSWPERSAIISCQSDAAQLKKIRKPPPVVVAEWLLSGVLQQRLDTQSYKLS